VFSLRWSAEAKANYLELKAAAHKARDSRQRDKKTKSSRQEGLFNQVVKTLRHLADNPRHPGLNTHKYSSQDDPSGKGRETFEAYAQNQTPSAYRVFWCYGPNRGEITILAITPHP
jgi:hypothetical protein